MLLYIQYMKKTNTNTKIDQKKAQWAFYYKHELEMMEVWPCETDLSYSILSVLAVVFTFTLHYIYFAHLRLKEQETFSPSPPSWMKHTVLLKAKHVIHSQCYVM